MIIITEITTSWTLELSRKIAFCMAQIVIIEWIEMVTGGFRKISISWKQRLEEQVREVLKLKRRLNMAEHSYRAEEALLLTWKQLETKTWKDKLEIRKLLSFLRVLEFLVQHLQNNTKMDQLRIYQTTFKWLMNQVSKALFKNQPSESFQKAKPTTIKKNAHNAVSITSKTCSTMTWNGSAVNTNTADSGITSTAWMYPFQNIRKFRRINRIGFVNHRASRVMRQLRFENKSLIKII